jgi:hypothetical protein
MSDTTSDHAGRRGSAARFEIRYDRWCGWLIGLMAMGRRFSGVTVDASTVRVRMGWAFRVAIPIASIAEVRPARGLVLGWGVHGWRGRWLVNGSSKGLVTITVDPPAPSRVVGFPGRLRRLSISLVDPDGFTAAVEAARR